MPAGKPRRGFTKIGGQFSPRLVEMLECPAFRVLSLSAHRVLARLEIECAHHGGNDNGKLPLTYSQLVEYGLHRHAIGAAIREAQALGFLEVTERGRAGNAQFRCPNLFRLTYRHTLGAGPTDEWRRIKTLEEAESIVRAARKGSSAGRSRRAVRPPQKVVNGSGSKKIPSAGLWTASVPETITEKEKSQCRKPSLQP